MTYAEKTEVAPDRSRAEIERTLVRYGATKFMYGWDEQAAVVMFDMKNRRLKFRLPLPDRKARAYTHTLTGKIRTATSQAEAYDQAVRQRWRALGLAIKAKLESVEVGIEQFDEAFMAQIVLPDGSTVSEWMQPQIKIAYEARQMPALLPSGS